MNQTQRFLLLGLTCALLAACGGGNSGNSDNSAAMVPALGPTEAVPPSASESSAGAVKYLKDLTASAADDKEPVDLGSFMPKTPEDTEPEPVS